MKNKTIGIISALRSEMEMIIKAMQDSEEKKIGALSFIKGRIADNDIIATVSSCGKVSAAMYAEAMITAFSPDYIINTGVAGALSDDMDIYDLIVAAKLVQHDMDTSAVGDPKGMISGINITYIPAPEYLYKKIYDVISKMGRAHLGIVASGDKFVSDISEKRAINKEYGAICCEMEAAAVAQVCYINKIDYAVIKIISDSLTNDSGVEYSEFVTSAANTLSQTVLDLIKTVDI